MNVIYIGGTRTTKEIFPKSFSYTKLPIHRIAKEMHSFEGLPSKKKKRQTMLFRVFYNQPPTPPKLLCCRFRRLGDQCIFGLV